MDLNEQTIDELWDQHCGPSEHIKGVHPCSTCGEAAKNDLPCTSCGAVEKGHPQTWENSWRITTVDKDNGVLYGEYRSEAHAAQEAARSIVNGNFLWLSVFNSEGICRKLTFLELDTARKYLLSRRMAHPELNDEEFAAAYNDGEI